MYQGFRNTPPWGPESKFPGLKSSCCDASFRDTSRPSARDCKLSTLLTAPLLRMKVIRRSEPSFPIWKLTAEQRCWSRRQPTACELRILVVLRHGRWFGSRRHMRSCREGVTGLAAKSQNGIPAATTSRKVSHLAPLHFRPRAPAHTLNAPVTVITSLPSWRFPESANEKSSSSVS